MFKSELSCIYLLLVHINMSVPKLQQTSSCEKQTNYRPMSKVQKQMVSGMLCSYPY